MIDICNYWVYKCCNCRLPHKNFLPQCICIILKMIQCSVCVECVQLNQGTEGYTSLCQLSGGIEEWIYATVHDKLSVQACLSKAALDDVSHRLGVKAWLRPTKGIKRASTSRYQSTYNDLNETLIILYLNNVDIIFLFI